MGIFNWKKVESYFLDIDFQEVLQAGELSTTYNKISIDGVAPCCSNIYFTTLEKINFTNPFYCFTF